MPKSGKEVVVILEEAMEKERLDPSLTLVIDILRENPAWGDLYVQYLNLNTQINLGKISLITLAYAKLQSDNNIGK